MTCEICKCQRRCPWAAGPSRAYQNHRRRRCGGCRRDRRARASCEAGPGCGARGRRGLAGHTRTTGTAGVEGAGGTGGHGQAARRGLAGHTRTTGTAGVEGAGGSCRRAGGRWRGLAGLRDDAPSEARGADGSRAGRRPPAHTAAGPDGARNTSGTTTTDTTTATATTTDTDTTKRAGTSRFRPAPDARAWAISSERPPCHPCRSSRR